MFHLVRCQLLVCALAVFSVLGGCATTGDPRDPLESVNRGIYYFNDGVDTMLVKPLAEVYRGVIPQMVRTGVSNVFSNLNDVIVALNNLLQGKFESALSDIARIMVNTTVGLLGIFDVATDAGLEKHDEDFGQTLGYWGVGDGAYLVLPFLGPRTVRDTAGLIVDIKTDPVTYIDPTRDRNAALGLRLVAQRESLLGASKVLEVAALDQYAFVRDAYLQRRRNLIYDGNPPREKDDYARAPRAIGPVAEEPTQNRPVTYWSGTPLTPAEEDLLRLRPAEQPTATPTPETPRVVRLWLSPQ